MALSEAQKARFFGDGYIVLEKLITADDVALQWAQYHPAPPARLVDALCLGGDALHWHAGRDGAPQDDRLPRRSGADEWMAADSRTGVSALRLVFLKE